MYFTYYAMTVIHVYTTYIWLIEIRLTYMYIHSKNIEMCVYTYTKISYNQRVRIMTIHLNKNEYDKTFYVEGSERPGTPYCSRSQLGSDCTA